MATQDPKTLYQHRLARCQEALAALDKRDEALANWCGGVFLAGLVLIAAATAWASLRGVVLLLPFAIFFGLVLWHARVVRAQALEKRRQSFYEAGLARLEMRWSGKGDDGLRFVPADHPYALDLDLFGKGSLFELLCTARTQIGAHTLAEWLLDTRQGEPPAPRQDAVQELRSNLLLREELYLLADDMAHTVHPDILKRWAAAEPAYRGRWVGTAAAIFAGLNVLTLAGWAVALTGPLPFLGSLFLSQLLRRPFRGAIEAVSEGIGEPGRELEVLARVMARMEKEAFLGPHLRDLVAALRVEKRPASECIAQLERLVNMFDAQRNQLFWPIGFVLLWDLQWTFRLDRWRCKEGASVETWLDAVGEMEALLALANYAYEHPQDPFADWLSLNEVPRGLFDGEAVAHPLLAEDDCIRNDVALGNGARVWMVSGSNMSGKSTLLRTVGVNTVLARLGAPVRAAKLRLTPLALGATMRVQDSLEGGRSRFYAEIVRIKTLMDLASGETPLLFLLDEVLHGTNSHDRQIGAAAIVEGLLERGALGLVTTHDLALAEAAKSLGAVARNVHFEDQLVDGKLHFDYRLREGVVERSNALALMRSVGLSLS